MSKERVQKILARAGIASRRKAEELIVEGEVTINGKVAQLGDKAEMGVDAIKVKGKLLHKVEAPVYLAFYKPKAVISAFSDPEGRPSLETYLKNFKQRLFPVGRLDFNTEGLLLLTNDGTIAEKLQKSDQIPRIYHVKVKGHPTADQLHRLGKGAKMEERLVKPHSVHLKEDLQNKAVIEIVFLGTGAIDVKGFFEIKGFLVDKLQRFAVGQISVRNMTPGQVRPLKSSQIEALIDHPELGIPKYKDEEERMARRARQYEKESPIAPRKSEGRALKPTKKIVVGGTAKASPKKTQERSKSWFLPESSESSTPKPAPRRERSGSGTRSVSRTPKRRG